MAQVTWWRARSRIVGMPHGRLGSRNKSSPSRAECTVTYNRLSVRGGPRKSRSVGTRGNEDEERIPALSREGDEPELVRTDAELAELSEGGAIAASSVATHFSRSSAVPARIM